MEYNSIKNQEIKGAFVGKHVYAMVTYLVEYILKASTEVSEAPFCIDDIENLYYYEDADGNAYTEQRKEEVLEEWNAELEEANERLQDDPDNAALISRISALERNISDLEDADMQYCDIYEWWIVSGYLANRLSVLGEVVLNDGFNHYWGRCTTGQAILLDLVISRICEEMQILEGQQYEWKV